MSDWFYDMFMNMFSENYLKQYEEKLNELYFKDGLKYQEQLAIVKNAGYKVLRNSHGKHKVIVRS